MCIAFGKSLTLKSIAAPLIILLVAMDCESLAQERVAEQDSSVATPTESLDEPFWLNGNEHSWLKVRSSVIRLIKNAFQSHGISMPGDVREVVFPQGLPVTLRRLDRRQSTREHQTGEKPSTHTQAPDARSNGISTKAEGGLSSEAAVINAQAGHAPPLNDDENLLSQSRSSASNT